MSQGSGFRVAYLAEGKLFTAGADGIADRQERARERSGWKQAP